MARKSKPKPRPRKPKAKPRRATNRKPVKKRRATPRPRKPAQRVVAEPESANLPAVRTREIVPADTQDVKDLVAANFYELATGLRHASIPQLALMDRVPPRTLMAWLPFCRTPKQFRWWRGGPGAHCERGVTCRTCQRFDDCDARLEYVPGSFVKLCLNTLFPGRWSLDGVTVERFHEGDTDEYHASGYLVVKHNEGTEQRIFQIGSCPIRKGASPGFYRKGAVTDLIKKAASELGIAYDVYSGRTMQHDVPPDNREKTTGTGDVRKAWSALFQMVDKRLREHPKSVHKNGYTPRMAWEDAANLWEDFGDSHPVFKTTAEALDCYTGEELPVDKRRALYAKIRLKWLRSDKALQDAKYGAGAEPPDDYRPDDASEPTETQYCHRSAVIPIDPNAPRRSKQGDVAAPKFKLWCQKVLGVRTWAQAEPMVNQVVNLYAERNKRPDLTDWLDLDPLATQNFRALLQEEVTKGTFGKSRK